MTRLEQIKMMRQALGLPNPADRTYRNRYAAAVGSRQEAAWLELVDAGLAVVDLKGKALTGFALTRAGAEYALAPGESLDPEDFPQ